MRKNARKAKRNPDPQQQKVYDWEDGFRDWNRSTISLKECRRVITAACTAFKIPPIPVKGHNGTHMSYSAEHEDGRREISLRKKDHLNYAVALHEAAHYITDMYAGARAQCHGPSFLGVYIQLLVLAEVAPAEAIYASARKAGLKWRKS